MATMRWTGAMIVLATAVGCWTVQFAVPTDLSAPEEWTTELHRGFPFFGAGSLSFGPFQARCVRTGSNHDGMAPFHYDWFVDGEGPVAVGCEYVSPQESVSVGRSTFTTRSPKRLHCTFGDHGELLAFERSTGESILSPYEVVGKVTTPDAILEIQSWDRTVPELRFPNVVGYVVRQDAKAVAAVSTMNSPRVWMAKDLAPEVRKGAAIAVSALLLHSKLQSEPLGD